MEKGNIIEKDRAEKNAAILAENKSVAKVEVAVRSSTEQEGAGATSVSVATDVFQATAPSTFSRKRKLNEWKGDRSRTVSPKEKEKGPCSHKL